MVQIDRRAYRPNDRPTMPIRCQPLRRIGSSTERLAAGLDDEHSVIVLAPQRSNQSEASHRPPAKAGSSPTQNPGFISLGLTSSRPGAVNVHPNMRHASRLYHRTLGQFLVQAAENQIY